MFTFDIQRHLDEVYNPIVEYLELCRSNVGYGDVYSYYTATRALWREAYKALQLIRFSFPREPFKELMAFLSDYLVQVSYYISFAKELGTYDELNRLETEDIFALYLESINECRTNECLFEPDVSINYDSKFGKAFELAVRTEALSAEHYNAPWTIGETVIQNAYEVFEEVFDDFREDKCW